MLFRSSNGFRAKQLGAPRQRVQGEEGMRRRQGADAAFEHGAAVEPTMVRISTMKDQPSKCKGFAFLEFAKYDKMELCLTKFHHSMFNDGVSEARKINVELTYVPLCALLITSSLTLACSAGGGGGKSVARKEKLVAKNEKLNEERQRTGAERVKDKVDRRTQAADAENGMHPSRRRRIE